MRAPIAHATNTELERSPFDVERELRRVVDSFSCSAALKGLALRLDFSGPNRTAIGDANRISQVLRNLLDNAIKFTCTGSVSVRAAMYIDEALPDPLCIKVSVTDTGPGIPAHLHEMVFAAFTQADETTTRRFGGTGLGLALSQELCHAMNGSIQVSSVPGSGARFTFHVRCGSGATRPPPAMAEASAFHAPDSLLARRVLVAEDNAVNRKVLEHMLSSAGIEVHFALDGEEASSLAAQGDYDLVLMDVSMPRMNGYDATMAIRAMAPAPRSAVPIIGVTALAMEGDRERCLAAGMNGYVSKPLQRTELLETIRRHVAQSPTSTQPSGLS